MTALNDAERAAMRRDAEGGANRSFPTEVENLTLEQTGRSPAWLPSRRFIAAVVAIGGMQLLATMDSTVAIVALPKIQDELSLSDAGRSWVIGQNARPKARFHRPWADFDQVLARAAGR